MGEVPFFEDVRLNNESNLESTWIEQICSNCRYYDDTGYKKFYGNTVPNYGFCRRYAPQAQVYKEKDLDDNPYATWLSLSGNDWCGEWKEKQNRKG
jgi:hypothetical protein